MSSQRIKTRSLIGQAWDIFQDSWWKLILFVIGLFMLGAMADALLPDASGEYTVPQEVAEQYRAGEVDEQSLAIIELFAKQEEEEVAMETVVVGEEQAVPVKIIGILAYILITVITGIIAISGTLQFARREQVSFTSLLRDVRFVKALKYVVTMILFTGIVIIGLILLIIPGILFALMFMYAPYLVIDKNMGPIEALKESKRLTKGNRWTIFKLWIWAIALSLAGLLALVVGLLVAIPVVYLSYALLYNKLLGLDVPVENGVDTPNNDQGDDEEEQEGETKVVNRAAV